MEEKELSELIIEYCEEFGEAYPIYAKPSNWSDEDIAKDIKQCIELKTPSKAVYKKNRDY